MTPAAQQVPRTIRTDRLVLRRPAMADAQAIFEAYARDQEVTRYLSWEPHQSISDTRRFLRERIDVWREGSEISWAITRAAGGALIGMIGAHFDQPHMATIGYVLARSEWNKGYMTEGVRVVVQVLMDLPQVYRVQAVCDLENVASARVMEKAGMEREGVLRRYIAHVNAGEKPRDVYMYAKVR